MEKASTLGYSEMIRQALQKVLNIEAPLSERFHLSNSGGYWQHLPGHIFHVCHELFLQISGTSHFFFPDEELILNAGEILLVPPGLPHKEFGYDGPKEAFRNCLVTIGEHYLDVHIAELPHGGARQKAPVQAYPERVPPLHRSLCCQLADALAEAEPADSATLGEFRSHLLRALVAAILNDLGNARSEPSSRADWKESEHPKIVQAKRIINRSELTDSLPVTEIARRVGCSANYLSTLFRQETGQALKAYLNRTRLERARDMLLNSPKTIGEISFMYGFRDAAYFSRLFTKTFGVSPREFRQSS